MKLVPPRLAPRVFADNAVGSLVGRQLPPVESWTTYLGRFDRLGARLRTLIALDADGSLAATRNLGKCPAWSYPQVASPRSTG